jgi:GNAT superfamily N-acetyltransferase/uncharacterized protein YndB with AHSA1/START domain
VSAGSHEARINVPPDEVWESLVAPGSRDWYYRLAAEGTFAAGEHVAWIDSEGGSAEESEVVEIDPPRRLVLRTRFVFAPPFAAAAPHVVTWEVAGDGKGSLVRMSWEADGPAARLLESEGDAQLQGLRLEVDPVARAELSRLLHIGEVAIRDVTPDRIADYEDFFDHHAFRDFPAWQSCYCMETHHTQDGGAWSERTGADNRGDMIKGIEHGQVTGLLAYVDGKPVGWCNYGESTRLAGLVHKLGLEAADHDGVGSVACFVIAAPYRGHGIAARLLDEAIDRLRSRGLRSVEAYPSRVGDSPQGNYRGPLAMYLRAGFAPHRETDRYLIVRKALV